MLGIFSPIVELSDSLFVVLDLEELILDVPQFVLFLVLVSAALWLWLLSMCLQQSRVTYCPH